MTYYALNDVKMYADITESMAIIINSETGVYYGLNELGTEVFSTLLNGAPSETVIEKLKTWIDNAEEQFSQFMDFLLKNEIILPSNNGNDSAKIEINESTAKSCDYKLKAEEYLDAQELLLADPIHEVKEEEGWSPEKSSLNEDQEDVARREAKMREN